jgi:TonB family protein
MRSTVLATLILAPVLAHAQSSSQAAGNLQARVEAPAAMSSAADVSTAKSALRVSTGVSEPQLVRQTKINFADLQLDTQADNKVVVGLTVDQYGNPHDVQIVKSLNNKALDERVVSAVRQFHYRPAQLDAQAIPVHVSLSIVLQP